jgi:gliding motility-associated-like protein
MKRPVVIFFLWFLPLISLAQVDTVFWFVAPEVTNDHADRPINLVVSSTQDITPTNVTISMPRQPAFTPINITLTGFETHLEDLEARINLIEAITPGIVDNKGILIRADAPITAYYEVDPSNNRDIFSLKGDNALGYEFFCPVQNTYNNHDNSWAAPARNRIDIVATENGTIVEVYITAAANGQAAGSTITTPIMQAGQTYSIVADDEAAGNHLGGSHVTSNNKLIAVTISDDSVDDPGASHYDLLGDQLVPIQTPGAGGEYTIGQEFIVIRTRLSIDEHYYIVATDGATNIEVDGVNIGTINTGATQAVIISGDTDYISCDKRVYLFHVGGFQREMGGALLPTIDGCKGSTRVSFTRTSGDPFYINLLVEGDATDAFYMEYEDGTVYQIPQGNFTQVPDMPAGEEWYFLDRGVNDFPDAQSPGVPNDEVTTIYNTETIFQMGLYNGTSSTGCKYGYFSDFKTNESSAVASGTNSDLIELCYGDSTFIRATGGINYQWNSTTCTDCMFGDLTKESIKVKPPSGSHVFFVEITNPCKSDPDTAKVIVNVDSLIQAYYTTSDPLVACDSISVATINNTIGERDGYQWILDGAAYSTDVEPILNYKNTGTEPDTIPITLAAYRYLCADAFTRQAIIYPAVNADFEPIDTAGCSPFLVPFSNTTSSAGNTYKWTFDDGNLAFTENPQNTYINNTTANQIYDVNMVATSAYNCKDTAEQQVTVFPPVTADFFINKTSGCAPLEINVTNLSTMTTIDSIQWVWGDGDTAFIENPGSHIYQNTTGVNINLTLKLEVFSNNGCSHTETVNLTIFPQVSAGFDQDLTNICHGTLVTFTDTSIGPIISKKWDFSDGTILNNIGNTTHTFQNFNNADEIYTVYQTVVGATGCSDTATYDITVHPAIFAGFSSNRIKGCSDLDVVFTDQSLGPVSTYEWDWGDGSPLEVAAGPVTHTYTNNTDVSVFRTSQQVVFNAAGCSDTAQQLIEIYPIADATFTATPLSGCNPLTVDFEHTPTNAVPVELTWEFGDNSSGSEVNFLKTYEHFNNTTTPFDVTLVAQTDKGCSDTARTTINVGPYFNASFTIDTAGGCSPFTLNPVNTSTGGIDSWTWKKENIVISNSQNPGSITLFNNTNTPVDTVITLIASNSAGACVDSIQRTITVYPSVDASIGFDAVSGCNPLTVNFSNGETVNSAVWDWDFGDGTSSNLQNPSNTFENNTNSSRTYTTQLIVSTASKCADTATQTITVASRLEANFTMDKSAGCSPLTIRLRDVSLGEITNREWRKENILLSSTNASTQLTLYNNTDTPIDTVITLTISNSGPGACSSTKSRTVTIYPSVDATFTTTPNQGCTPLDVQFTHTPSNNPAMTYLWDFDDNNTSTIQNPLHTFINTNTSPELLNVQLKVQSVYGCVDSSNSFVTVGSYFDARMQVSEVSGCSPFQVQFTDISEGNITGRTWYRNGVSFSNLSNPQIILTNTSGTVRYDTIMMIARSTGTFTCYDTTQRVIAIYPEVDPSFSHLITEGCNPLTVNFTHPVNSYDYLWDFGDNSSANTTNPTHTFTNDTELSKVYEIKLVAESEYGCKDSAFSQVTVASRIDAKFTMPSANGCSPYSTTFTDASNGDIASWKWYIDNNLESSNNVISKTFTNTTSNSIVHNVKLIVTNTGPGVCKDSVTKQITVYPQVFANIGQNVTTGCNPLEVQFTHNSPNNPTMTYLWDFGDNSGSSNKNPLHTFTNDLEVSKDYDIKLLVESDFGCKDSAFSQVTVASRIDAQFTIPSAAGCSPYTASFTDVSSGDIVAWQWYIDGVLESSNSSATTTLNNITSNNTIHNVKLIVRNSGPGICKDSITKQITTYPQVFADISQSIDEGCNPLNVQFTNNSPNNPTMEYLWDFGDNSSSYLQSPGHTFVNDLETTQNFDIKLLVESEYGCKDSAFSEVTVASRLKAEFTMPSAAGCSPKTFNFTDASEGDIATYRWYIDGNLNSSTNFANTTLVNTTNNNLVQNVKLVVTNTGPGNCADSITKQITAYPEVTANFVMDTNRGCNPLPINFTYAPGNNTVNVNFDWDFGDNTSSDEQDPPHVFEHFNYYGTSSFEVKLTTTSLYGCTSQHQESVTVERALKAEFTTDPSAGCNPFNAEFINVSKGAENYQWIYGDGSSYNINFPQTVSHEYTNQSYSNIANYTAKLIVTNTNGLCSDSMQQQINVYPQINSSFTVDKTEGCHPVEVSFTNLSQGVSSYYWNFDDETNSSVVNPVHTFRNTSNTVDKYFNVNLLTTNGYECTSDTTITIRVNHNPRAQFTIDQTASCSPLQILASNTSLGFDSYEWRTGDGQTTGGNPLNYTYNNTTNEEVSYKLELYTETNKNCKDSTSLILNAYPNVVADFNITNPQDCNPLITDFENLSVNTDNYFWDFGNGTTSNQTNPGKRFAITGYENETIPVKLIASSAFDCVDSITKNVTVYVQPNTEFEADPFIQQWPDNLVTFTDLTNGGPFDYVWNFDDGQTSSITNSTTHTYGHWGDYEISLIVANRSDNNCADTAFETITIEPPIVIAEFTISDTAGCVPHTVTFEAESSNDENYNFYWDFGDNTESNEQNPTKEYRSAGVYIVTLTVEGEDGFMYTTGRVTVHPKPEVNFTMEPRFLQIPGDFAQCYNLTPFPNQHSFYWDFGDGSTSTDVNPTQHYTNQGLYNVTLTATNTYGCDSSLTRENYIQVEGKGNLKFPNAFTPSLAGSSNGSYDPNSTNNDIFFPITEGVIEYKLLIYNRWGELMFQSDDVNIGWDGYYNGKICPQDVYIWKAEGKFKNGNSFEETGDVTLLR